VLLALSDFDEASGRRGPGNLLWHFYRTIAHLRASFPWHLCLIHQTEATPTQDDHHFLYCLPSFMISSPPHCKQYMQTTSNIASSRRSTHAARNIDSIRHYQSDNSNFTLGGTSKASEKALRSRSPSSACGNSIRFRTPPGMSPIQSYRNINSYTEQGSLEIHLSCVQVQMNQQSQRPYQRGKATTSLILPTPAK
jgi:hypothetical protein